MRSLLARRGAAGALALIALLAVAACGKRGGPIPPGPADQVSYPRVYPSR